MTNSPLKPFGRSLSDFTQDRELSIAEQKLLEKCRIGKVAGISEQRPTEPTKENTVRADFVRFLALGGDEQNPVHERGVKLYGAWVEGDLDFQKASLPNGLVLVACQLDDVILQRSKNYGLISFDDSQFNNLSADGMISDGDLYLKNSTVTGTIRLIGIQINGSLGCTGGNFKGKDENGVALHCDRAVIKAGVFFNAGFIAEGTVRLSGAKIGGNLTCNSGKFNGNDKNGNALFCDGTLIKGDVSFKEGFIAKGTVRLIGAKIGNDLICAKATFKNISATNMAVAGVFYFNNCTVQGEISLPAAKVGSLSDDINSWTNGQLFLDGFVYERLAGRATTNAKKRIAWLNKQLSEHAGLKGNGENFRPQPWQQLQKVLREMGHIEDARQVGIAFEKRLYDADLIGQSPNNSKIIKWIGRQFHQLFGWLIGYGYRPLNLVFKMFWVWLICGVIYWQAASCYGVFAPTNPLIFENSKYETCAKNWYLCEKLPEEYTGFSPLAYSLDLILPLVDLQQERDWSPMIPTPESNWTTELFAHSLKHVTRLVMWFEILFGWLASLLLVAVVSGLTKRREE